MELLKCELLPRPPAEEQAKIAHALAQMTRSCDYTISRAESEIDLLREYRTRLIADVVTGKLDVREAAASLPEAEEVEPPEEEPIDEPSAGNGMDETEEVADADD